MSKKGYKADEKMMCRYCKSFMQFYVIEGEQLKEVIYGYCKSTQTKTVTGACCDKWEMVEELIHTF